VQVSGDEGGATAARRITPCLWFDHQAQEAVAFCPSIFHLRVKKVDIAELPRIHDE
jgi:predicted 3-demethylubiquinone-9 3-methyltransferase (glyoxalase superfamily)